MSKSTVAEIRERFDKDVERFSNLESGQISTLDAPLTLELITEGAKTWVPHARNLLDVGCGAGNFTLKMLSKIPNLKCTLLDLSLPMLEKAKERVKKSTNSVEILQADIREANLKHNHYDIILAGAVLHHLRDESDWEMTFQKLFDLLKPGGCLMVSDLVVQDDAKLNALIWKKYGDYLETSSGREYRKKVLDYIEKEDSPRSVLFQLNLMKKVGFSEVEILHKNLNFAAFGGKK